MEKIKSIIEAIAHDKNISYTSAKEAFKQAIINTGKRLEGKEAFFEIIEDENNDKFDIYRVYKVTNTKELLEEHPQKYISLEDAKEFGDVEEGDEVRVEFHLEDYGTTGASHLYRELEYHLQRKG